MNLFQKIAVENIKSTLIQQNNKRWIIQKVSGSLNQTTSKEKSAAVMFRGKFCIKFDQAAAFRKLFPSDQDRTNFLLLFDRKSSLCDNSKRY